MPNFENVPVSIRLTPDGSTYQVGTEINGLFQPFTFGGWPASSFEAYVKEGADKLAEQQQQQAQQQAQQQQQQAQ